MATETEKITRIIWDAAKLFDRQAIRDAIFIYRDNWYDIVFWALKQQFKDPGVQARLAPLITTEINLCKFIVNQTAMVYKNPAVRSAKIGDAEDAPDDSRYAEILESAQIEQVMKTVNKYTRLLNHVLIRPVVRNKKLEYDIILPDSFEIYTDEDDWRDIVAIKFYIGQDKYIDRAQTAITNRPYKSAYLWVKKPCRLDENVIQPGIYHYFFGQEFKNWTFTENPYKDKDRNDVLPFILTHKEFPVDNLLNFSTDSGMVDSAVNVAIYLTLLNELMKFQAYKQIVITGGTDLKLANDMQTGPGTIWEVLTEKANAGIDVLDMQADIDKFWTMISQRIGQICALYGIPPSAFTLSGTPQSGYAMKIDRAPLLEIRQNDVEFYRGFEKDLFEMTRLVNNTDLPNQPISNDAKFKIEFGDIEFDPAPQEEAAYWSFKFMNNLATPVDYIMQEDDVLTREEATKKYEENKAINTKSKVNVAPLSVPPTSKSNVQVNPDAKPNSSIPPQAGGSPKV